MTSALGIALALWLAPPQPQVSEPEPRFCDLAVRSGLLEYAEFSAAAELRLPGVRLREATSDADPSCVGRLHGYVELREIDAGTWELSLICSDGRAWFRNVASEPDQASRALASALANLVAAIEDASVEPDARDVDVPTEIGEVEPVELAPIPEPVAPAEPEPEPEPEPNRVVLEIGPRLAGVFALGLTPGAPGLRGGGGAFGLDLRLPDGLGVGLDVRGLTNTAGEVRLVRTRIALGFGWIVRSGIFEVPVMLAAVVEPWLVRAAGSTTPLGQPPMVGGGARVAPGILIPIAGARLRVGLPIGFELAVEAAPGGLAPAISRDPDSPPILRAGGVELSFGLELGVWIPVRER